MDLLFPNRLAGVDLQTSETFDCEQCFGHGPYQTRMLMLILLGTVMAHCQTLVVSFVTSDVDHWCKPPDSFNISADKWKHIAIPMDTDGRFSRCRVYERCKPPNEHNDLITHQDVDAATSAVQSWYNRCLRDEIQDNSTQDVPCDAWDYDVHTAESSTVSTWDMVCDRQIMRVALVGMPSFGSVVGLFLVGAFADYMGRRTLLLGSAIVTLTCTICMFVAAGYQFYAMACFLAGCSVAVTGLLSYIVPFESMTHAHRPQQLLVVAVICLALCDVWTIIIQPIVLDWRVKQVIFLTPGLLLFPTLYFARESPRWLVAKGRLNEAEVVMRQAATINNFPLPLITCLIEKLKEQLKNWAVRENTDTGDLLDARSLRRRALATFVVSFSISLVLYVDTLYVVQYEEFWISVFTVVLTLLTCAVMHYLIAGVTLVTVLTVCFVITGCMQSAISIAATLRWGLFTKALLVLSKSVSNVFTLHCLTYIMELFPSAIRASVCCYSFGFCRIATVCAVVMLILQPAGYEDVVLAMTALLAFASLLAVRYLPKTTVVEDAKIVAQDPAGPNRIGMDHMKQTLEGKRLHGCAPALSKESTRSSQRKRLKHTGSSKSGGSKACPRPNMEEAPK